MIGMRLALERATIQRAVDTFPSLAQALMLAEECGELVVAVSHVERGRAQAVDIPTEIADVLIMVEQLVVRYGLDGQVDAAIKHKLARLRRRLDRPFDASDTRARDAGPERKPGCLCTWEEGDSPCPVHGDDA